MHSLPQDAYHTHTSARGTLICEHTAAVLEYSILQSVYIRVYAKARGARNNRQGRCEPIVARGEGHDLNCQQVAARRAGGRRWRYLSVAV